MDFLCFEIPAGKKMQPVYAKNVKKSSLFLLLSPKRGLGSTTYILL